MTIEQDNGVGFKNQVISRLDDLRDNKFMMSNHKNDRGEF